MFTGIVEAVGAVRRVEREGSNRRIVIEGGPAILQGVRPGDSIAVDGACLTPVETLEGSFTVEAVGTTLARTIAGRYGPGTVVNLERAMVLGGRLDGHLVQGHVDGIGEVQALREEGGFRRMEVRVPEEVHRLTLERGSIALNGVSLTVNRLLPAEVVEVAIIPHTWEHTNFRLLRPGDAVNVEGDLIGKYVGKLLLTGVGGRRGGPGPGEGEEVGGSESPLTETSEGEGRAL